MTPAGFFPAVPMQPSLPLLCECCQFTRDPVMLVYSSCSATRSRQLLTLRALDAACRVSVSFYQDSITPLSVQWQLCPSRRRRRQNLADVFNSRSDHLCLTRLTPASGLLLSEILWESRTRLLTFRIESICDRLCKILCMYVWLCESVFIIFNFCCSFVVLHCNTALFGLL